MGSAAVAEAKRPLLLSDNDAPTRPQRHVAVSNCDLKRRSCGRARRVESAHVSDSPANDSAAYGTELPSRASRAATTDRSSAGDLCCERDPSHVVEIRTQTVFRSGRLTTRLSGRGTRPYTRHFIVHGPLQPIVRGACRSRERRSTSGRRYSRRPKARERIVILR